MTARPPRAVLLLVLVAIGITVARWVPDIFGLTPVIGAIACAAIALLTPKRLAWTLAAISVIGASWGWASLRWYTPRNDHLPAVLPLPQHERSLVTLEGILLDQAQVVPANTGAMGAFAHFEYEPLRAHMRTTSGVSGVVRLRIDAAAIDAGAGDRVRVRGWFTPPRPVSNPGANDFSRVGAERDDAGTLSVPNAELVELLGPSREPGAHVARWLERLRSGASRALPDGETPTASLLRALVLGERGSGYQELNAPFARSGLAHILAISGMHLAVLAGLGALAVRCTGDRPRLEAIVVIALVLLVLLLVPARAPIVRAGIIAFALTFGVLTGRRYHPIALLAWAGILVLAWRPSELFSPGFQLSFGIVAALVTLAQRVEMRVFGPASDPNTRTARQRAWLWLRRAISASWVAWLVSIPLVAHAFGVIPFAAPLTALVALPIAGLILGVGYGAVIVELIMPGSTGGAEGVLLGICEPLLALVRLVDAVPLSSVRVPALSAWWAACATGVLVWWCARGLKRRGTGRKALLIAATGLGVWTYAELRAPGLDDDVALRIDALALGDGSCYLVRSGDEAMLFDCGSRWTGAGVRMIPDAARALGVPSVRDAVVSHPDIDHYACLPDASETLGVRTVRIGQHFQDQARANPDGPASAFLELMTERGANIEIVQRGDVWTLGSCRVEVLAPETGAMFDQDNDHALVLRISAPTDAGQRIALLVGDLEDDGVRSLRDAYPALRADFVEAPHHGSARDVASAFLLSLDPSVVVQSTGPTRIDLPVWEPVRENALWFTTAIDGAIGIEFHRDGSVRGFPTSRD